MLSGTSRQWTALSTVALLLVALAAAACAPAALPSPTPIPKAAVPTAAPTKAAEAAKPAAPAPTATAAATPTPRPATVKFGSIQTISESPIYLAIEKGFFKEQGITLELTNFSTSRETIAPLGTEKIDFASSPVGAALLAAADRNIDLRIVAGAGMNRPGWDSSWILLRKDLADSGQVKTPEDLKGMTLANPFKGSVGEQTLQLMLEEAKLKTSDVKMEELMFDLQEGAFANKVIAASFDVEPFASRVVQNGFAVKWMPSSKFFGGQYQSTFIVFGPSLLRDKELGQRWMIAYLKGIRAYLDAFAQKIGRDEAIKILTQYTTVKDPKFYDLMQVSYQEPDGGFDKKSTDMQYEWAVKEGLYTGKKTFADITDMSLAQYAVQKLGRYQ